MGDGSSTMEELDCVVVGAGWYGLGAAKQYHCTQPEKSLAIIDSGNSLGGTWAEERLYPRLRSNNLVGAFEFPDFPMDPATFGINPHDHIPGESVHRYMKAYVEKFGIADLIRLESKVVVAEHQDSDEGGWILTVAKSGGLESKIYARKLIVASGLTSDAWLPHFAGQETFGGKIFHSKHFLQNRDTLQTAKSVTVFGGTKSAWDAVYAYATAGVKVHWVIRSSGHGPCWMAPPYVTPFKKWIEQLANTRFLSWFSPCIWGDADGFSGMRNFYHGTAIGRAIVNTFWKVLGNDTLALSKYDSHPKTAKLKPWIGAMWAGTSFSIFNYETSIFDLVKGDGIEVYIGEIDHLSTGKIHLADGTEFESDAFLVNTGWKHVPAIKFLPQGIEKELGIPHNPDQNTSADDLANQRELIERVDKEILSRFPRLRDQPVWNRNYVPITDQKGIDSPDDVTPCKPLTPYMLYHFIIPPSERFLRVRDTAFIGMVSNFSNIITAHIQGLWISAYFQGLLENDPGRALESEKALESLQHETALYARFGHWRYPTDWGHRTPSFVFDAVPYLDLLMRDLGLNIYRKTGWLANMYQPYGPEDYRDVTEEWQRKYGKSP